MAESNKGDSPNNKGQVGGGLLMDVFKSKQNSPKKSFKMSGDDDASDEGVSTMSDDENPDESSDLAFDSFADASGIPDEHRKTAQAALHQFIASHITNNNKG